MKILSFESGSLLKELQQEANRKSQNLFPFTEIAENIEVYPYALKYMYLWLSKCHMYMQLLFSLPSYGDFGLSKRLCRLIMICIKPLVQLCPCSLMLTGVKICLKMYSNLCKMFVSSPMIFIYIYFFLQMFQIYSSYVYAILKRRQNYDL